MLRSSYRGAGNQVKLSAKIVVSSEEEKAEIEEFIKPAGSIEVVVLPLPKRDTTTMLDPDSSGNESEAEGSDAGSSDSGDDAANSGSE